MKTIHVASKEQYDQHENDSIVAAKVWDDFVRANWPDLVYAKNNQTKKKNLVGQTMDVARRQASKSRISNSLAEQWLDDDASAYANLAIV